MTIFIILWSILGFVCLWKNITEDLHIKYMQPFKKLLFYITTGPLSWFIIILIIIVCLIMDPFEKFTNLFNWFSK